MIWSFLARYVLALGAGFKLASEGLAWYSGTLLAVSAMAFAWEIRRQASGRQILNKVDGPGLLVYYTHPDWIYTGTKITSVEFIGDDPGRVEKRDAK